jgi:cyclase
MDDFAKVFTKGMADAALAAGVFHERVIEVAALKDYLFNKGINVRR